MAEDTSQPFLFEATEWWQEHWKGMPEYVQKDLSPLKTLYVHFEKAEDVRAFAKLVGQQINMTTQFIWYPEAEIGVVADKRWIDASATPPQDPVDQAMAATDEYDDFLLDESDDDADEDSAAYARAEIEALKTSPEPDEKARPNGSQFSSESDRATSLDDFDPSEF